MKVTTTDQAIRALMQRLARENLQMLALIKLGYSARQIDAIILTGGAAYSKALIDMITEYVRAIAPVVVMPGENEIEALAQGGARLLKGEEKAREYIWPSGFKHQTKEEEKCFQKK